MRLEGLHHVTAITADAPGNVDFYARLLGLRLVKKTVNFDQPDVYHLYFGDERGTPGSILTFFEFPGAAPGRAGAGMVHTIGWRVGSEAALDFWAARLEGEGVPVQRDGNRLRFADPEGLRLELAQLPTGETPLVAAALDIPAEHALQGFDGARAYTAAPERSAPLLSYTLGFEHEGDGDWICAGAERGSRWSYDAPPPERGIQGAGTVHHIAWASLDGDHEAWRRAVAGSDEAGRFSKITPRAPCADSEAGSACARAARAGARAGAAAAAPHPDGPGPRRPRTRGRGWRSRTTRPTARGSRSIGSTGGR